MFSTTQPSLAVVALGYGGHGIFVNNTVIGTNPTQTSACTSYDELTNGAPGVIVENNAIEGCGILVGGTGNFPFATFDYNAYANWSGYHCFFTNFNGTAIDVLSYSSWQAMSGLDTHSAADTASIGYGVDAGSTFAPSSHWGPPRPRDRLATGELGREPGWPLHRLADSALPEARRHAPPHRGCLGNRVVS